MMLQPQGPRVVADMMARTHELDPTRLCSAAVNAAFETHFPEALDMMGFNYNLKVPDEYHKEHPKQPSVGSETASTISTRGIYSTDKLRNWVSAYDVNHTAWSELAEEWWKFYATREWLSGGFAWTGFDYRGEPTPYGWPSINSQFGIVDMCGFPKDNFYYYKAWWGTEPVLHLFPHWNWERAGRRTDPGVGALESGFGRAVPEWQESGLAESSAADAPGVEGEVRARSDRSARHERRQSRADGEARDHGRAGSRSG